LLAEDAVGKYTHLYTDPHITTKINSLQKQIIVRNEVLHKVKDDGNILLTRKRNKANRICLIFRKNCLPKHVMKGREDEEENVSSCWMILRKREDTGN